MYDTGKLAQVTAEMRRYSLHILGVSESRRTGSGRMKTSTGETVLYSGRNYNQHYHVKERSGEKFVRVETCQQQNHQDQDKGETAQHYYHPVLCPNK